VSNNRGNQTGGARRPIKELLSWQFTKRKQSLKQLELEAMIEKKERRLLYAPILKLQKGVMSGLMKPVMSENQNANHRSLRQCYGI
jgi:hypothetical protein